MCEELKKILEKHPQAYPKLLAEKFPQVAKKIALLWNNVSVDDYFASLLIVEKDRNRSGFPMEVVSEIITLQMARDKMMRERMMQKARRTEDEYPWGTEKLDP